MRLNDQAPSSIILQRLQAEEAFRQLAKKKTRQHIASTVRTLWSGRALLCSLLLLGSAVGVVIGLLIPARYTSTVRLMPPDNQSSSAIVGTATSVAASAGSNALGEMASNLITLKSNSDVFVAILNSRTLQDAIIARFDLKRAYGSARLGDARRRLAAQVETSIDRKTQMITISVTDRSPQRAQAIAAAYLDQLNRLVSDLTTSSARRERIFLEGRLAQITQDLQSAEKEFGQFASQHGALDIKEQARTMVAAAATIQGQLMLARSELEGLRQIYADSHPRLRALQARIVELQSQLEKFGGKDQSNAPEADADAATLYPPIRRLPLLGITYSDLYRRSKVEEAVYEALTQEYELAKVQEAREIPTVKVLDAADLPETKSFPPRLLLLGASSAILSSSAGIAFLLCWKSWHESDPHDASRIVMTEIWQDVKQRRFLSPSNRNGSDISENKFMEPTSLLSKARILSLLGLSSMHPDRWRCSVESAADDKKYAWNGAAEPRTSREAD